jgi:hypothetical protein
MRQPFEGIWLESKPKLKPPKEPVEFLYLSDNEYLSAVIETNRLTLIRQDLLEALEQYNENDGLFTSAKTVFLRRDLSIYRSDYEIMLPTCQITQAEIRKSPKGPTTKPSGPLLAQPDSNGVVLSEYLCKNLEKEDIQDLYFEAHRYA